MLKLDNNYICALDIGASKLAACLAQVRGEKLSRIFFETTPLKSLKQGSLVDSLALVEAAGSLLKKLKAKSGINIKFIYVNISGKDIVTKHSCAIIPLAERGNKVITASDIQEVNEQARILGSSLEEELIEMVPLRYAIDAKYNIINPLGLYSHRLEVELYLVCARVSSLQGLNHAISQAGYQIKDIFFSGLATAKAAFNQEYHKGFNVFCDIGADTTELLLFSDGMLKDMEILPAGGDNLTQALMQEFKISFDLAEEIKRSHGIITDIEKIKEDEEILVKKSNLYQPIKQRLVCEIISAGAKSLCAQIKEILQKRQALYEMDNFIIAGRTVLLEGFMETLEHTLSLPVKLARINNREITALIKEDNTLSGHKYLSYLTSLGMLIQASATKPFGLLPLKQPAKNLFAKVVTRFKEVYQEYF